MSTRKGVWKNKTEGWWWVLKLVFRLSVALILAIGLVLGSMWIGIEIQGGGPPRMHKEGIKDLVAAFREKNNRWPQDWRHLTDSLTAAERLYAQKLMDGVDVRLFSLKDGGLLILYRWTQFGYPRADAVHLAERRVRESS